MFLCVGEPKMILNLCRQKHFLNPLYVHTITLVCYLPSQLPAIKVQR